MTEPTKNLSKSMNRPSQRPVHGKRKTSHCCRPVIGNSSQFAVLHPRGHVRIRVHPHRQDTGLSSGGEAYHSERCCRLSGLFDQSHLGAVPPENGGQSLKTYIDEKRGEVAKRLLAFSDLPISAIADQLDFPDVFSFSHFFKRKTDHSPREFREAANAPH